MDKKYQLQELGEYRVLVESAGEGLCVLNKKMLPIFVNRKVCDITSYSKNEILGKNITRLLRGKSKDKVRKELKKRGKGYPSRYTLKFITKRGKELFLSISGVPRFDKKGKFNGSIAIISDITERKRLEDKLEKSLRLCQSINRTWHNKSINELNGWCIRIIITNIISVLFGYVVGSILR